MTPNVPFRLVSSISTKSEHGLMLKNDALNICCEIVTKMKRDQPVKESKSYYLDEPKSKMFDTLEGLFKEKPLLAQKAAKLYKKKVKK